MKKGPDSREKKLIRLVMRHPEAPECLKKIVQEIRAKRRKEMEETLRKFHKEQGRWSLEDFQRELEAKKNAVVFGPYSDEHPVHY